MSDSGIGELYDVSIGHPPAEGKAIERLDHPSRLVSGIRPYPNHKIHLGHYCGVIRDLIASQYKHFGQVFVFIADYHALPSISDRGDYSTIAESTRRITAGCLALGMDPSKTCFYQQSAVPALTELGWIVSSIIPLNQLCNTPTTRTLLKSTNNIIKLSIPLGTLAYPALMAADILALRATEVPAGDDQGPHIEIARKIARKFNRRFQRNIFPEPYLRLSTSPRIIGTDGSKMDRENIIGIFEDFRALEQQVSKIITMPVRVGQSVNPADCLLFKTFSLIADSERIDALIHQYQTGNFSYGELKDELIILIQRVFGEAKEKYHQLMSKPLELDERLREGSQFVRMEVTETMEEVRELVGLRPSLHAIY